MVGKTWDKFKDWWTIWKARKRKSLYQISAANFSAFSLNEITCEGYLKVQNMQNHAINKYQDSQ